MPCVSSGVSTISAQILQQRFVMMEMFGVVALDQCDDKHLECG